MEALELVSTERFRELAANDPATVRIWAGVHDARLTLALKDPGRMLENKRHDRARLKFPLDEQADTLNGKFANSPFK